MSAPAGIRFEPPWFTPPPGLTELLRLAFARGAPPVSPHDWSAFSALDLAVRLPGAAYASGRRLAAANHLRLQAFSEDLAEAAAKTGAPIVFLKFAALALTSRVAVGSRNACDVDVLVPAPVQGRFEETLREMGVVRRADYLKAGEQHSAPLFHPSGLMLEIHDRLLGMRLPGGSRSVRFDDLERSGHLVPLPFPSGASVLSDEALVAHLVVHGIAQHGLLPSEYPLLRLVGDLIDLGAPDWSPERRLLAQALVAESVSEEEFTAVLRLAGRLSAGDDAMLHEASFEGVLLRHMIAGTLDESYRNGLKLRAAASSLTDGSRVASFLRALPGALVLSNAEVDAIYGPPRGPLGHLARKLARPFDLVFRAVRYAVGRPAGVRGGPGGE